MRAHFIVLGAVCLLLVMLAACSDDCPTCPDGGGLDTNAYLSGLGTWEEFSPPGVEADGPTAEVVVVDTVRIREYDYQQTSQEYSLTSNPEKIVTFEPDKEILWLGSLLQGATHRDGIGSLQELPIRQRGPITISVDLLTGDNTAVVENPNVGTVTQAIGRLVDQAAQHDHVPGSSISFEMTQSRAVEESALRVGLSARYMGASVKGRLGFSTSREENTLSAVFIQKMFTASMALPQTPGEVFSEDFTRELLQEQVDRGRIGPDNPPVYVSSIVFGRIMMLTMTSRSSTDVMERALKASYKSIGGMSISSEDQTVLQESEIRLVTVGGDANLALALLRDGNLGSFFASDTALTSARPISYTMRHLPDNRLAVVTETTKYNVTEYKPIGNRPGNQFVITPREFYVERGDCDPDDKPDLWYSVEIDGVPVCFRPKESCTAVLVNNSLPLQADPYFVELFDDLESKVTFSGYLYDSDGAGSNDKLAEWNLDYNWRTLPEPELVLRFQSKDGGDCTVQLIFDVERGDGVVR